QSRPPFPPCDWSAPASISGRGAPLISICLDCTPCNLRACPFKAPHACEGGRTLARDPCGCCDQCTRLEWEPCGGHDWTHGYCALGLTCASVNRTGAAVIPEIGVCKGGWKSVLRREKVLRAQRKSCRSSFSHPEGITVRISRWVSGFPEPALPSSIHVVVQIRTPHGFSRAIEPQVIP
uniref:IGFBP N-terminal domain-containing protein n=1 Tax=Mastacembelus armatus TaxID=205130 RepID=A0A7N8YA34_9TELE